MVAKAFEHKMHVWSNILSFIILTGKYYGNSLYEIFLLGFFLLVLWFGLILELYEMY